VKVIGQQGIFTPRQMEVPISITTAPAKGGRRPYDDQVGPEGLSYHYWDSSPQHRDNLGLRRAFQEQVPLVWFYGLRPGLYHPVWPVVVAHDDPEARRVLVVPYEETAGGAGWLAPEGGRRYAVAQVRRRLHQARFRQAVLSAYGTTCAICRLRHASLLDAAHILPDRDELGVPVVPNGMALCKLHHAAFDRDLLGVRPDLVVEVSPSVLEEADGPVLTHGLQGCHGSSLLVPRRRADRPDPLFLEERYERFRRAS